MLRLAGWVLVVGSVALAAACGDDGGDTPTPDAGIDASPGDAGADAAGDATADGGVDGEVEGGTVDDRTIPGLGAPVDVVRDDRGFWHIYAADELDAMRVEGFLMARDRMLQMELIRRSAKGELSGLFGSIEESVIEEDIAARWAGYRRSAELILASLEPNLVASLEAFAAGINVYIERLRAGSERIPADVGVLIPVSFIEDWTVIDSLSIARLQTGSLSFDVNDDIPMTEGLLDFRESFPADSADPRIQARADAFHDFFPFTPVHDVWVTDGFPNLATDTGTRAIRQPRRPTASRPMRLPSRESLRGARRFLDRVEARFQKYMGDEWRGSNSWVVHGSKTASGNPLLANDPHLSLSSPPLFWHVHLNTKRRGGDLDVQGLALAGTPVVLLGFNDHIAWGLTTHGYDVTDAYLETITPGTDGDPDTVEFDGEQVAIETVTETIELDNGTTREVVFERVPHHGLIIPNSRTATEAITIKWTGHEFTNEVRAIADLNRATNIEEAEAALDHFGVGGQCFVVISRDGDIFYTSQINLPVRPAEAMTYDPATQGGVSPSFVLDGTGPHEWQGFLSDRFIPHALNPEAGFIATANGDAVGVTGDGNPFNDPHYIGWNFADGYRIARITEQLEELSAAGGVTPDDMKALQGDAQSPFGRLTRGALVAELDRAIVEMDDPGTHADLETVVAGLDASARTALRDARDRLAAWSFDTPAAVEGEPSAEEVAESVAATIFNVAYGRIAARLLADELDVLGRSIRYDERLVIWALTEPERLATYDADFHGGDTVLWDDLSTEDVESRGEIVVNAFAEGLAWLESELGAEPDEWRWGKLHTVRFDALVPQIVDSISVPPPDDPDFPDGFPRQGDRGVVDASGFSLYATEREHFSYGGGPQQRLVVEMTPEGPVAWNAIPGGQVLDPRSPHHADEAELWRKNEAPPVYFTDEDVQAHAELEVQFVP